MSEKNAERLRHSVIHEDTMGSKLRVLVLCEFSSLNGGERSLLSALDTVCFEDIDLFVAAPALGPLAETLHKRQITHFPFAHDDDSGRRLSVVQRRSQLAQLLTETGCHVLHANSLATSRLAGPVARHLGIPSVGHLRDIMRVSRQAVRDICCHNRLLAVSEATKNWYVDIGIPEKQILIEYNGVDLSRFRPRPKPATQHRDLGLPDSAFLVGSVGQICIRKGLDVLIESALAVLETRNDVHFVIVGARYSQKEESRVFEQQLQAAANKPPLLGHIHFLGQRDDVSELMAEWDLLLHVARQEPLGRVLLEAAASGLATVATDVGGTREIFPPEQKCAVLVPPSDASATAKAIIQLLDAPKLRERLGRASRHRTEQLFDARATGMRLSDHYREVASLGT